MSRKAKLDDKARKEMERRERKIRFLYAVVWFLACPLAFVVALLLGFSQINVVYWTLLVIPVLLGVYNVRQLPPVASGQKAVSAPLSGPGEGDGEAAEDAESPVEPEDGDEAEAVPRARWLALLGKALKAPVVIALPLLVTLVVDLIVKGGAA